MRDTMRKTQVQLSEAQVRAIKALAAAQNKSVAEVIRQAVDIFLSSANAVDVEERKRRALAAAGRFHSGTDTLSTDHDRHLVEAYRG
jgi:Arc/MetJ-type ribon-helix-helix transcriptional regulator